MDIKRQLNLPELLKKKSFFLLGPRGTGKTTLIRQQLSGRATLIDLLRGDVALRLASRPEELEEIIAASRLVVIDEIQKLPHLLDEVHRLIETKKVRFLLTGSSARKLKARGTNLLAGRAWRAHLFPLSWSEIPHFDLDRYLLYGGLPSVYLSDDPHEELKAYVQTYLYEEIRGEALVRKIPAFSRFLEVAALSNGELLNFTSLGSDSQVSPSTVREYYSLLEDTLIGTLLKPWTKSKQRKAIQTAKFIFFDVGVANSLAGTKTLDRHSNLYGNAFEQFIGMELKSYLSYQRSDDELTFWRSVNRQEVDYLVGDHTAIEVKATRRVTEKHLHGLRAISEEQILKKLILISQDPIATVKGKIACLHWEEFLKKLWDGKICG